MTHPGIPVPADPPATPESASTPFAPHEGEDGTDHPVTPDGTISFLDAMMEVLKHFQTINDLIKKSMEVPHEDTKNLLNCTIFFSFWTFAKDNPNNEEVTKILKEKMLVLNSKKEI